MSEYSLISKIIANGSLTDAKAINNHDVNPYKKYYEYGSRLGGSRVGYIFGKPFKFNRLCDPDERIYQKMFLRNHTIVSIVPGVPSVNHEKLNDAKDIVIRESAKLKNLQAKIDAGDSKAIKEANEISAKAGREMIETGADLRYMSFKYDPKSFFNTFNLITNKVGTAIFGISGFVFKFPDVSSSSKRGFGFWAEKGTSISEDVNNNFQASVFSQFQRQMSSAAKQIRFAAGITPVEIDQAGSIEVNSRYHDMADQATITHLAENTVKGATYNFPDVFDSSEFSRNYNISFKFQSPLGDDRSIFYHVIVPFLFLVTISTAKQEGPSGVDSPFIMQLDAPGYFSTSMGVATSLSFTKGGDEKLFNRSGLPLVIEGTLTVRDLYASLTLPQTYAQFTTNVGIVSFLENLGGMILYESIDPSVAKTLLNKLTNTVSVATLPISLIEEKVSSVMRTVFGSESSISLMSLFK